MDEIHDMCALDIQTHRLNFILNPQNIWQSYNEDLRKVTESNKWKEIKFLNDDASALNSDIKTVPKDCGGVYVFVLKGGIIPDIHMYIMYVGRVQFTDNQNLNKRLHEYFRDNRPKIRQMREVWGRYLYIRYLPLKDNCIITQLEEELIRVIIPPCNDSYPKVISKAIKAAF